MIRLAWMVLAFEKVLYVRPTGIEPATSALGVPCSIRLSYGRAGDRGYIGAGFPTMNVIFAGKVNSFMGGRLFPYARRSSSSRRIKNQVAARGNIRAFAITGKIVFC